LIEKSNKSISYIIAAYNEDTIIKGSIEYSINCLEDSFEDYELILVNDGSKDKTGDVMDEIADSNDKVIVLHNLINLNFGISVQRALSIVSKDYAIYNAADLPLDPVTTSTIINLMNDGTDLLVLQRKEYLGTNIWRRFASFINRLMVLVLFPKEKWGIRDTNYIQVFRKEIIKQVLPIARSPIFTWPEMIFRAKRLRLKIKIHDIEYKPIHVRKGAFGKPHDIIWGMYDMVRFRIKG
jgi:glycosyltransferase involved in cell wall biosynthesis